jgi:HSP20 family protein
MERLFEGSFIAPQIFGTQGSFPPIDVYLTDDEIVIEMGVPGANPDDINISVTGDTVSLSGEVKHTHQAQKGQGFLAEIPRGAFHRSFTLPIQVDADQASAGFNNGILELRLPKSAATKPRKIQVKQKQQTIQQSSVNDLETESVSSKGRKASTK